MEPSPASDRGGDDGDALERFLAAEERANPGRVPPGLSGMGATLAALARWDAEALRGHVERCRGALERALNLMAQVPREERTANGTDDFARHQSYLSSLAEALGDVASRLDAAWNVRDARCTDKVDEKQGGGRTTLPEERDEEEEGGGRGRRIEREGGARLSHSNGSPLDAAGNLAGAGEKSPTFGNETARERAGNGEGEAGLPTETSLASGGGVAIRGREDVAHRGEGAPVARGGGDCTHDAQRATSILTEIDAAEPAPTSSSSSSLSITRLDPKSVDASHEKGGVNGAWCPPGSQADAARQLSVGPGDAGARPPDRILDKPPREDEIGDAGTPRGDHGYETLANGLCRRALLAASEPGLEPELACYATAPFFVANKLACEVAARYSPLAVAADDGEELVSHVVSVRCLDSRIKLPSPITVAVPYSARYRGAIRDVAVRVSPDGLRWDLLASVTVELSHGGRKCSCCYSCSCYYSCTCSYSCCCYCYSLLLLQLLLHLPLQLLLFPSAAAVTAPQCLSSLATPLFAQASCAESRCYGLGLFAVVLRPRTELVDVPRRGTLHRSAVDARLTAAYPPGTFAMNVVARHKIQAVETAALAAAREGDSALRAVASCSPLLHLAYPSGQAFRRPVAITLPCPPAPERKAAGTETDGRGPAPPLDRAHRTGATRYVHHGGEMLTPSPGMQEIVGSMPTLTPVYLEFACLSRRVSSIRERFKGASAKPGGAKRRLVLLDEEEPHSPSDSCGMSDRSVSGIIPPAGSRRSVSSRSREHGGGDLRLLVLRSAEPTAPPEWEVQDCASLRNLHKGLVTLELDSPVHRLLVARVSSPVDAALLARFARGVEAALSSTACRIVARCRASDPGRLALRLVAARDADRESERLAEEGYDGAPSLTSVFAMREGEQLVAKVTGNVTAAAAAAVSGVAGAAPDSACATLTFHAQRRSVTLLELGARDEFANRSSPHYKGAALFFRRDRGQIEAGEWPAAHDSSLACCRLPLALPKKERLLSRPVSSRMLSLDQDGSGSAWLGLVSELSERDSRRLAGSLRLRRATLQSRGRSAQRARSFDTDPGGTAAAGGEPTPSSSSSAATEGMMAALAHWRGGLPAWADKRALLAEHLARAGRWDLAASLQRGELLPGVVARGIAGRAVSADRVLGHGVALDRV
ncbi:uncharacterized protein LOC116942932 [Petromyzon marinus]|uniref:uncharacterized protein LOC116942932 n=1 Tax=Petromyzon marinus TaxID=7757 RepID=UPI003F711842